MLRHAKIRREPDFCNTIAKNLHKQPQNRHRRRRFADLDDVDSEVMEEGQKRFRKSARGEYDGRGVGKVK